MTYFSKILAKPEEKAWPLPSHLFHAEKKRRNSLSRMKSFDKPLFLFAHPHTNLKKFADSDEASKMAKISDNSWIFDGTTKEALESKLKTLGIKFDIQDVPKDYKRKPDLFSELENIPSDLKKDVEENWQQISKQASVDQPEEGEDQGEDGIEEQEVDLDKVRAKSSDLSKIKSMKNPYLFIIDMGDSAEKRKFTDKGLHSPKNEEIFSKLLIWSMYKGHFILGVCPAIDVKAIKSLLNREQIDFAISKKAISVLGKEPFTELEITDTLNIPDEDKLKEHLNSLWQKKDTEEEDEEESFDIDSDKRKGIAPEKFKKIRKMVKPYLFLAQTKEENKVEFEKFIKNKDVINSLARCVKYILTKKSLIRAWIVPESQVKNIQTLAKKFGVSFSINPMPKDLNDKDQPFTEVKINLGTLGKVNETDLRNQLNENWVVSQQSVVKKPTLEMNSLVPLDYLRFLNPESKQVELYLGGHPVDVGMLGIAYVLLESEEEGEQFKETLGKLNLPEKVYEDMDTVGYLPKGFTGLSPKKIMPANCLILHAKEAFDPNRKQETLDKGKTEKIQKKLFAEIKKISGDQLDDKAIESLIEKKMEEYGEKAKKEFSGVGLAKTVDDFDKKIDELFKKNEEDLFELVHKTEATELDVLHLFAKDVLKANISQVGSFVSTNRFIGTHAAHFSRDMKICILWGTTGHAEKIDMNKVLADMPFVKSIDDTYA